MGIRNEIEAELRRRVEMEAARKDNRAQLIRGTENAYRNLLQRAREAAAPYIEKVKRSKLIEVLEELFQEEKLSYRDRASEILPSRDNETPGHPVVTVNVKAGDWLFRFHGLGLIPDDESRPWKREDSNIEQIQKILQEILESGKEEPKVDCCAVELSWGHRIYTWEPHSETSPETVHDFESIAFCLNCREFSDQLIYYFHPLDWENPDIFEGEWNKDMFRKVIAKRYVDIVDVGKRRK